MSESMIKIDGQKLRGIIKFMGRNMAGVSAELGYSSGFLAHATQSGKINKTATILLERLFGIDPDAYVLTEKGTPQETKEDEAKDAPVISEAKLEEIVYKMCKKAVEDFWG